MLRLNALLLILLLSLTAAADTITAAGDPWPPFLDPDHPQQGVAIAIAREAFKTQGHDLEFTFVPWARAIDGVKNADYDALIGTWWTEERTAFLEYSDDYLTNQIKFIKRKDDDFEFDGLKSLKGKTVGTVRGYGYGDDFANADYFSRAPAARLLTNIRKLIAGRLDLTLEDELVARSLIAKEAPELLDKIAFTNNPLSAQTLHVTSGLKNPRHKMIIEAFNKGLKEIKANGTFERILEENHLK
ncbi:transporter substrate-binding domain-containing protein [Marinobacteraceae bacterium S3BR75-40.1]